MTYYLLPAEYEIIVCRTGIAEKTEYDEYSILNTDITTVDFKGVFPDEEARFSEGKRAFRDEDALAYNVVVSELPEQEFYKFLTETVRTEFEKARADLLNTL